MIFTYFIYMKEEKTLLTIKILSVFLIFMCNSCVSTKNITYFQDLSASKSSTLESTAKFVEPVIQSDDILSISIITIDPQSAAVVNQSNTLQGAGTSTSISRTEIQGFLVDRNGDIDLALIGKLKVAGLTTYQATEKVRELAARDFKDPKVSVRFANFKVSVLGEVNKPAAYSLPNEKVTILDALSLAGDLTLYGKRENILVIREQNGKKEMGRLNINSSAMFSSPYYYLRQNDVIYVEPVNAKVSALNAPVRSNIGIAFSAISIVVLIATRLF